MHVKKKKESMCQHHVTERMNLNGRKHCMSKGKKEKNE